MCELNIRLEQPNDYKIVERLIFAAFETMELPGRTHTNEHFLAHLLRTDDAFASELDFVAEHEGEIAGNILYSKCKILRPDSAETAALVFGPLSVKPELHGQGIGSLLVRHSLDRARELGYTSVLIMGHPDYYHRFGFVSASKFGITMPDGASFDALMALELAPGTLGTAGGKWTCCKSFDTVENDVDAFVNFHKAFMRSEVHGFTAKIYLKEKHITFIKQ
jgi:predicted N-acetyltransferase YhbS